MAKSTRTFKIGEYARGGVITAEVKGDEITIIGKEWDFSQGSTRGASQKNAKEWIRFNMKNDAHNGYHKLQEFLCDLTSYGWADKIMKWIETKIKIIN